MAATDDAFTTNICCVADKWTSGGTMINNIHRYAYNRRKREMSAHHKIWITILIEKWGAKIQEKQHIIYNDFLQYVTVPCFYVSEVFWIRYMCVALINLTC